MTRKTETQGGSIGADGDGGGDGLRLDKWLWQARFFKTRSLAGQIAAKRKIRVNRVIVTKSHYKVRPGDVLTFAQGHSIRVVRVLALGVRRGPAPEARTLYEEIVDEQPTDQASEGAVQTSVKPGALENRGHGQREAWTRDDGRNRRRARKEAMAAKMNGR
jgi:ribosome-associated heat shock protein Hsp15